MIKTVPEFEYKRFTLEEAESKFEKIYEMLDGAKSPEDVVAARESYLTLLSKASTAMSLSYCRYTLNTRDEFYIKEKEYYDEITPVFSDMQVKYAQKMLVSPYKDALIESGKINPLVFKTYELADKAHDERNIEDEQLENTIVTEYSTLMSQTMFDFMGEKMPLAVLRGKLTDGDRSVRRAASEAIGRGLEGISAQLDDIFDRLVKVRDRQAKRLGFESFTQLGYYRMNRIGYDREMVEKFRKNVSEFIVPAVAKIKEQIRVKLGWDKVMFYDNDVCSNEGAEKPIADRDGIFAAAQEMYDEMNPAIGDFMRSMMAAKAFDVDAREGKWGGGYCTEFNDFKQTFILANFNGSSDDINVITHEFGHAFAMNAVYAGGDIELGVGGMETAECHSMSMEFLCWRYIDKFFANGDNYRLAHLLESLTFIPYGVMVDEFQHRVYDNPSLTAAQRKEIWRELERVYRPYMTTDGIPYLEQGTRWQYQAHIYELPFYYIDYCLAQTVALGFLSKSRENYDSALSSYVEFCKAGGTKPFSQLVKEAGIAYPFGDGTLGSIVEATNQIIGELTK